MASWGSLLFFRRLLATIVLASNFFVLTIFYSSYNCINRYAGSLCQMPQVGQDENIQGKIFLIDALGGYWNWRLAAFSDS